MEGRWLRLSKLLCVCNKKLKFFLTQIADSSIPLQALNKFWDKKLLGRFFKGMSETPSSFFAKKSEIYS